MGFSWGIITPDSLMIPLVNIVNKCASLKIFVTKFTILEDKIVHTNFGIEAIIKRMCEEQDNSDLKDT